MGGRPRGARAAGPGRPPPGVAPAPVRSGPRPLTHPTSYLGDSTRLAGAAEKRSGASIFSGRNCPSLRLGDRMSSAYASQEARVDHGTMSTGRDGGSFATASVATHDSGVHAL